MKITLLKQLLEANENMAEENRQLFEEHGIRAVNLMGSPGCGKTALLEKTLELLDGGLQTAVIEGDVASTYDAERLAKYGIQAVQIATETFGGSCHLNARMIASALTHIHLKGLDLLFIENIGNLICPAAFNLGEHQRVVVTSLTEGPEKPLKYPVMFRGADLVVINKMDLKDRLQADTDQLIANIKKVHPAVPVLELSAVTGEGCLPWMEWLRGTNTVEKPA